jgi:hypothetical protein
MTNPPNDLSPEALKQQVADLKLHGLLAHWHTLSDEALAWLPQWLQWEQEERRRRRLQRRLGAAHIGRFKPLADFDWDWPTQCDRGSVSALMSLDFITEAVNVILVVPNGVGKSMIAQNIAHQAVLQGHSALFINAAQCSVTSLRKMATTPCAAAVPITPDRMYWSSMRSAICPMAHAMPTCCLRSSIGATNANRRSSPPTDHLPNGARCFRMPAVSMNIAVSFLVGTFEVSGSAVP